MSSSGSSKKTTPALVPSDAQGPTVSDWLVKPPTVSTMEACGGFVHPDNAVCSSGTASPGTGGGADVSRYHRTGVPVSASVHRPPRPFPNISSVYGCCAVITGSAAADRGGMTERRPRTRSASRRNAERRGEPAGSVAPATSIFVKLRRNTASPSVVGSTSNFEKPMAMLRSHPAEDRSRQTTISEPGS